MQECKAAGCGRLNWAAGYCSTHYNRLRKTGSLEPGPKARLPLAERLWRQVAKGGPDECWNWIAKSKVDGYGTIGLGGRAAKKMLSHRVVWELTHGPIPKSTEYHGFVVLHKCDNRACCNPAHLVLGKQSDNVADMDAKGRRVNSQLYGSAHGMSKVTEKDVVAIRAATGTNQEIAKQFGITRQNVKFIRNRETWKHVK